MKTQLETITPDLAAKWLNLNTRNRPTCPSHVKMLAREIALGRWVVNGETIIFNDANLIDGQHRLMAIVQSGITIQSLVVRGVPNEAFITIDGVCKPRSNADFLSINGEKNTTKTAGALCMVDRYLTGRVFRWARYTAEDVSLLLTQHPEIRLSIPYGNKTKKLLPSSLAIAAHYLFSKFDREAADVFCEQLVKGTGITEEMPVFVLRNRLLENSLSNAKIKKELMFVFLIKTWNCTRKRKTLRCLRWTEVGIGKEQFPIIE